MSLDDPLVMLWAAFPRQRQDELTMAVYRSTLGNVPANTLRAAIARVVATREDPWMPTIGEILNECAEFTLMLPTEQQALQAVNVALEAGRNVDRGMLNPLVWEALDQVGGLASLRTADGSVARGQFGKAYREIRQARIRAEKIRLSDGK